MVRTTTVWHGPSTVSEPYLPRKLYTLNEANAAIATVGASVTELQRLRDALAGVIARLSAITPDQRMNGHRVDAIALEAKLAELQAEVSEVAGRLAEMAVEVKDLAHGTVDFPTLRE